MQKHFDNQLLKDSFKDLQEDFEELEYLIKSALFHLNRFLSELDRIKKYIRDETYNSTLSSSFFLKKNLEKILARIWLRKDQAKTTGSSLQLLERLSNEKEICFDLIRSFYGLIGTLVTSLDFQSPSFSHSLYSQAGKQTGQIIGTINDYKRDAHLDEKEYEEKYLKEYIDAPFKFGIHTYMTASGQAAFTTILNFLLMEGKINGKVILEKSSYFQYKQLLIGALKDKIIEVDEKETAEILKIIKIENPCCIFFDSLCNAKDIPMPDLAKIIDFLIKEYRKEIYLVIDNTCLSVFFQPFKLLIGKTRKVHLIVFESLMKYHHFGLDRATGGIIVAYGRDTQKLFDYRKHSGTNIADTYVYMFPVPNRKMLESRFLRLQRNATLLSSSLQAYLEQKLNREITKIVYPEKGSFFNIEFKKKNIKKYKKFIAIVISEAIKRKFQIVGGTSFGLNNTRIYLTSLWTKFGEPFVRIAAGTENRYQIEIIKEVLKSAVNKIARRW